MIKKAVVMAAGKGIRMLPLTEDIPKPLVEVKGKPFLYFLLHNLKEAGITDLGIIVGYKGKKVSEFLKKYDFKATIINQKEQLGTGHALMQAESFVNNENFIALGGDNLWSVADIKRMRLDDEFTYVAGIENNEPEKFGVIISSDDYIQKIIEKSQIFVGNIVNTGLYKFTPKIFDALKKIKKSSRDEYELTDAITYLAEKKKVKLIISKDYWLDLGKKSDIKIIEKSIKNFPEVNQ